MMIAIWLMARPRGRETKASLNEILVSFKEAFWPLLAPFIIIGGITTGFFTPTEAAVIATLYALALGFYYRDLKWCDLPDIMFVSLKQTCGLMFIIATANFFGWFTIFERIPDALIVQLSAIGASAAAFMWIVIDRHHPGPWHVP